MPLSISLSVPMKVVFSYFCNAIGINNLIVVPDSLQSNIGSKLFTKSFKNCTL